MGTFNNCFVGSRLWRERLQGLLNESSVLSESECPGQGLSWEMLLLPNPPPTHCRSWLALRDRGCNKSTLCVTDYSTVALLGR